MLFKQKPRISELFCLCTVCFCVLPIDRNYFNSISYSAIRGTDQFKSHPSITPTRVAVCFTYLSTNVVTRPFYCHLSSFFSLANSKYTSTRTNTIILRFDPLDIWPRLKLNPHVLLSISLTWPVWPFNCGSFFLPIQNGFNHFLSASPAVHCVGK